jgi:hypothetical protein
MKYGLAGGQIYDMELTNSNTEILLAGYRYDSN